MLYARADSRKTELTSHVTVHGCRSSLAKDEKSGGAGDQAGGSGSTVRVRPSTAVTRTRVSRGAGVAECASHSSPCTITCPDGSQRLGDHSDLAEEGVDAHQGFVVAGAHGETNEEDGDESEGDAGGDGGGGVYAHLRHRAGDESEHADHETDDAGEREHAMAGELDFEHHQDGGGEQQHDGGVVHGQQIEREEREQDQQGAERSGDDGAGRVELEIDEQGRR